MTTPIRNGSIGVPCPQCGGVRSNVSDSRPNKEGQVRRRRTCVLCNLRYTTYEMVSGEFLPPPAPPTLEEAFTILAKAIRQ